MSEPTSMALALEAALRHARDRSFEPALAALLEAWRTSRAPEIADVIDVLSAELTKREPRLRGTRSTTPAAIWLAMAREGWPATLDRLLEAVPEVREYVGRLRVLRDLPPDPRMGTWAARWLTDAPVRGAHRNPFFVQLVAVLDRTMDRRLLPIVERMMAADARDATTTRVGQRSAEALARHVASLGSMTLPSLSPTDRAALDAVRALLGRASPDDPASLFAQVYESPEDDGLREVLGDLLQQRGDPRGEFIALQLVRHRSGNRRTPREAELEREWGTTWLGALADALPPASVVFERGFVARARWNGKDQGAVPEWATVSHLDMAGRSDAMLLAPAMRSLRHVEGLDPGSFHVLDTGRALPWESVGFTVQRWSDVTTVFAASTRALFPSARRLQLVNVERWLDADAATLAAAIATWPTIEELETCAASPQVEALLMNPHTNHLERIIVHAGSLSLVFDRKARRLDVTEPFVGPEAESLAFLITLGTAGLVTTVDLRFGSRSKRENGGFVTAAGWVSDAVLVALAKRAGIELTVHGKSV